MKAHLEHGGASAQIPALLCLGPPKTNKSPKVEANWESLLLTVWETSQPGTHLDQISLTEGRFRWQHDQVLAQLAEGVKKERKLKNTKLQVKGPGFISFLNPGEGRQGGWVCRDLHYSNWLGNESWSPKATQVSRRNCRHQPLTWHCTLVKNNKTGGHSGTDSTMGGKMWGAALVQAGEISVPHFWKPVERMESLETPGGWL